MSKNNNKNKKKLYNQLDGNNFSNFPINSSLINIPIIPTMVNVNSNIPEEEVKKRK
ncbi:hypothetical protein LL037_10960 [Clostridium estertheticum]|uniref:Uncharacterized protein n=1 Tax=Clostridium estertheticum TaxID=238834 RepID=A0AA47I9V9_9CLOT|nr:hypothetical protein [Clostridium estertheticum]MBU3154114.1 hypothetical protein [Clostridium estertheticum]MBU3199726.1 hypothetical protein [Clostridium estertheticum]WAG62874.1 hypothetical protein LL038_11820 [Clostridium estertheticum]WAG67617.1 hypothetical protein LL037_10960 [Clostridium estertheticum]